MNCAHCGKPVDPAARSTLQRIVGWEQKAFSASRKSGSDIVLREHREEYLHGSCVEMLRAGHLGQPGSATAVINRERILSLAAAIREHAEILEGFAVAPDSTPYMLEKEALGRANLIEGRLAQLRDAASLPDETFTATAGTPGWNLHVLGDRPTDDEAA